MRLLITGGSGFLGRRVVPIAVDRGHDVVALVRSDRAAHIVNAFGAGVVHADLDDPASADSAFSAADADALVNLASLGFGHAPTIVAAAEEAGISRAVFVSTTAVATSLPAPSKRVRLDAEARIRASALRWTILRPTMIYGGPDDRNLSRLLAVLRRTPVLPVPGGGRRLQQPVHVGDIAAAVLDVLDHQVTIGACYDIAGPEPMTFAELLRAAGRAVGSTPHLVPIPLAASIAAARGYERVSRRPRIKAEQLLRLAEDKSFSVAPATGAFGYSPRTFCSGITAQARAMGLAQ